MSSYEQNTPAEAPEACTTGADEEIIRNSYTVSEMKTLLGVKKKQILKLIADGELNAKLINGEYYVDRSEFLKFQVNYHRVSLIISAVGIGIGILVVALFVTFTIINLMN